MNKKLIFLLLALITVLSLCACGQKTAGAPAPAPAPAPAATPVPAPAPTEEPAEGPADETATVVNSKIFKEADDKMINTYTILAVNPDASFVDADGNAVTDVEINTVGAAALMNWLLSEEGQALAANYGFDQYGEYLFYLKDGRPVSAAEIPMATEETKIVRVSTTSSIKESGLFGYLLPVFEEKYGYEVLDHLYSAGIGKTIANAKMGNADMIFVHSGSQEEQFVADGFSYVPDGLTSERNSYMYNYFVLCGPSEDPAGVADCDSVLGAFAKIADGEYTFVSCGANSGTHAKEISLWSEALGLKVEPESFADYNDWYISANADMGACLVMAEQLEAYILTDKATFLTFVANGGVMD